MTLYTYVNWREGGLLGFFDKLGLCRGDTINPEKKLAPFLPPRPL